MNRKLLVGVLAALILSSLGCLPPVNGVAIECTVEAFFTAPGRNHVIESRILDALSDARTSLLVAMYSFTDDQLGDAVVAAWNRGVKVWVILDTGQPNAGGGEYAKLVAAGIPVAVESASGLMHHKFVVIDGLLTITGSYNWSDAADTSNFENALFADCPEIAALYTAEFWLISTSIGTGWTPSNGFLPSPPTSCSYIGNKSSKIFHYPNCSSVTQMSEANKVCFKTRQEAIDAGYKSCGNCLP
jgi:phosphatidylserine/phosphatidylglycerophosphate/cardiolipin synthase-like enzyme